jgi:hypothetical protein
VITLFRTVRAGFTIACNLALQRLRQEDCKFKASLESDPISKNQRKINKYKLEFVLFGEGTDCRLTSGSCAVGKYFSLFFK